MDAGHRSVNLEFSQKYDSEHCKSYLQKHRTGFFRKLSHWREEQMARKALYLAGQPNSVLDLPCGAGRFWPLLEEKSNRIIVAADNSTDMLNVAWSANGSVDHPRIQLLHTSAFDIALPGRSVDCIFCIRLLHHIGTPQDRALLLREFHRVSRDTLIISLWVDGNYKAWRRRQLERRRSAHADGNPQNRFVIPRRQIEEEFHGAGFEILGKIDFLPFYQMWRTYVLRKY
ncbi:MAG: class I SAM-dependent methyltransferase [Deltaproteobacteria bacterium]|nr:class I SAM-dependent methyltransferase [Deltaproteobacteria bacterium]